MLHTLCRPVPASVKNQTLYIHDLGNSGEGNPNSCCDPNENCPAIFSSRVCPSQRSNNRQHNCVRVLLVTEIKWTHFSVSAFYFLFKDIQDPNITTYETPESTIMMLVQMTLGEFKVRRSSEARGTSGVGGTLGLERLSGVRGTSGSEGYPFRGWRNVRVGRNVKWWRDVPPAGTSGVGGTSSQEWEGCPLKGERDIPSGYIPHLTGEIDLSGWRSVSSAWVGGTSGTRSVLSREESHGQKDILPNVFLSNRTHFAIRLTPQVNIRCFEKAVL